MDLQSLLQGLSGGPMRGGPAGDIPLNDTSEQIQISSMALLKMLKHGKAGVPMEVMGLMLGEFIDDYTVRCIDVFAMPQTGTGVSVEAVDSVYQQVMHDMLKQTGRHETVVGWYHSHPGFGCWLSGVDINTQQSFEVLNPRSVAVVVDPIQSVRGKVVIDAFRLINPQISMMGKEPRQTTSNIGYLQKPTLISMVRGLNRHYYNLVINFRKNDLEQKMLMNLQKAKWSEGFHLTNFEEHTKSNGKVLEEMKDLTSEYEKWIQAEMKKSKKEMVVSTVGKINPIERLTARVEETMTSNIVQCLGTMLDSLTF